MTKSSNQPRNKYYIFKKCELCKNEFESLIKRNQRFCCGKCSAVATSLDGDRISKIRKTKLKRYGSETYVNPEKAKTTCLEKYGVDNASKSSVVMERIKSSNLEKFGVEWTFQNEDVKSKIKDTILKKYGTENPSQSQEVKEKVRKSFQEKYGCDNVFQNEDVKAKFHKSNVLKYGSKIPVNCETMKREVMAKNKLSTWNRLKLNSKVNSSVSIQFDVENYVTTHRSNKYPFKCNVCGDVFDDHLDGGHIPRCLKCNPYIKGFSLMEKEVYGYVKSLLGDVEIREKCRGVIEGELDILIPSKNLAIEFNGTYWHSELAGRKPKTYHLSKTEKCEEKNIQLIHIFEDEWVNKESIVKDRLRHILGENSAKKIHARKCEVVEISSKSCNDFLEKYHIQGKNNAAVRIALINNKEIVSVMTFGKLRPALGSAPIDGEYEMYRHCSSKLVIGGASKLLSHFVKKYKPSKITTYSDRRWSHGKLYKTLGFSFVSNTPPNYFYIKYGKIERLHRYNFTKHRLEKKLDKFDKNLTEWENMQLNGYDRVWDCGHSKWVYSSNN